MTEGTRAEAEHLLAIYEGRPERVLPVLAQQFQVLQGRTQLMLTLATITLTITGFSGPRIAGTNAVTPPLMALGLAFVLISVVCMLLGSLRIRWVTQLVAGNQTLEGVMAVIAYRDRKTRSYLLELVLLVLGLGCYVSAVIAYLFLGSAALEV